MKTKFTLLMLCGAMFGLNAQTTTERTTLVETFTSSTCPPCNPGNTALEGLLDDAVNDGKFVSVKYQVDWPGNGDPYFHSDVDSRRGFYGVSSVPRTFLDKEFNDNPSSMDQTDLDAAYAVESFLEITAYYQINEATQTVDVQIHLNALQDIPGGTFLHVAIIERLSDNNVASNGETEFINVVKKMAPSSAGTYVGAMDAGEESDIDVSYTFNGSYILPPNAMSPVDHSTNHIVEEFSDLRVAVWLQRSSSKVVYNSTYAVLGFAGVEESKDVQLARIYPNPATDNAIVTYTINQASAIDIQIMDVLGKVVYTRSWASMEAGDNQHSIDTSTLPEGLYLVQVKSETGSLTKKLHVKR